MGKCIFANCVLTWCVRMSFLFVTVTLYVNVLTYIAECRNSLDMGDFERFNDGEDEHESQGDCYA